MFVISKASTHSIMAALLCTTTANSYSKLYMCGIRGYAEREHCSRRERSYRGRGFARRAASSSTIRAAHAPCTAGAARGRSRAPRTTTHAAHTNCKYSTKQHNY